MATKKQEVSTEISILEIKKGRTDFCILGKTPIVLNSMPSKAKQEFLFPKGKKTAAEKKHSIKHDPYAEFRESPYKLRDEDAPTYLAHLATAFKGAIAGAALDIPGAKKAQIGRLLWIEGEKIPIYGIPKIFLSVTRSADMNKTPDIRSRAIIPEWVAFVSASYITPVLRETAVANLLAAAGLTQGIGDWRPEKGKGNYGQFELADGNNKKVMEIIKKGGRQAQIEAMENPEAYDIETEELLSWFFKEAETRGVEEIAK